MLFRLLSHFWPVRIARVRSRRGTLDLAWENGRLVVNSANANQSWGSLQRVWERAFQRARIAQRPVRTALVLGMGAGGVVKLIQRMHPQARITAVDDDPAMIRIAREHFDVGSNDHTHVVEQDAFLFMEKDQGSHDLVVVDLFEDHRIPDRLRTVGSLRQVAGRLHPTGSLLINTMLEGPEAADMLALAGRAGLSMRLFQPFPENRVLIGSPSTGNG